MSFNFIFNSNPKFQAAILSPWRRFGDGAGLSLVFCVGHSLVTDEKITDHGDFEKKWGVVLTKNEALSLAGALIKEAALMEEDSDADGEAWNILV